MRSTSFDGCSGLAIINDERLPYDEQSSDSDFSHSSSEPEESMFSTELEQILDDISRTISYLYELAIAIRNPTPIDRSHKAKKVDTSFYETWDILHVKEKFPMLERESPFLLQRLGKANSLRRQTFKYSEAHNKKIRHGVDATLPLVEILVEAHDPKLKYEEDAPIPIDFGDQDEATQTAPSTSAPTISTQTTATTFVERKTDSLDLDLDDRVSETSSIVSEDPTDGGVLKVPEPPAGALDRDFFECPYCFEFTRAPTRNQWRQVICKLTLHLGLR